VPRSHDPGTFHATLDPDAASVAASRHDFTSWLTGLGVTGDQRDELAIVFSELAANAAHASAATPDRPVIAAWQDHDTLILEAVNAVCDATSPAASDWDVHDPLRTGGRGLMIARAHTDHVDIQATHGQVLVRCRRNLDTTTTP